MTDEALKGELIARLKDRLTTTDMIDTFLRQATGVRLFNEYATDQTPKSKVIKTLVDAMDDEGTLPLFLRQVFAASPQRPDLQQWLRQNFPPTQETLQDAPAFDFQIAGRKAPAVANAAGGLQRYVRPALGDVDILKWFAGGLDVARRVCRIEINRNGLGTGFLVGPNLVLTNWHVVKDYVPANATDNLSCRFDYAANPAGGVQDGEEVDVATKGILAWSPAAASEAPQFPGLPALGPDTLDFALLKLDGAAGEKRGWFDLDADAPSLSEGAPLLIVQHPQAAPLKLALDTNAVMQPLPPQYRLRYSTNTDRGSSGSPVLTMDWKLVALHHLGDPRPEGPQYNEGVPILLIREKLRPIFDSLKALAH